MDEAFSLAGLLGSAVRVFWRLALVAALIWIARRRGPYRVLLIHRGHGLAAVLFAFAGVVMLRGTRSLGAHAPGAVTLVLAAFAIGSAAFVIWGLAIMAAAKPGRDRLTAALFFAVSLIPALVLLVGARAVSADPSPAGPTAPPFEVSGSMPSDSAAPGSR